MLLVSFFSVFTSGTSIESVSLDDTHKRKFADY